jgi:hypothetical protein
LNVELEKYDLDVGEELPHGGEVKVLQIITQQKMAGEEDNLLDVTERDVKIGNYELKQIVLKICQHASHFYSSLILYYR